METKRNVYPNPTSENLKKVGGLWCYIKQESFTFHLTLPVRGERRLVNDRIETASRADTFAYRTHS